MSFSLGYPNRYDRLRAWTGSALMVHGDCVSIGCYAMGDTEIEEIYTSWKRLCAVVSRSFGFTLSPSA